MCVNSNITLLSQHVFLQYANTLPFQAILGVSEANILKKDSQHVFLQYANTLPFQAILGVSEANILKKDSCFFITLDKLIQIFDF